MGETLQSLDRALAILATIGRAGTCSLPEVAKAVSLPSSTVHRILLSLMANGYVIRHGRGHYAVGPAALGITQHASLPAMLAGVGRPVLLDLARQCRASSHLGILDGDMVTYLAKHSFGRERILSVEGTQLESYCSGIGKVLLAYLSSADRARYLSDGGFVRLTPNTIIDPAQLAAELDRARAQGWAADDEEMMSGLRCIAVPVFNSAGQTIAALSVGGRAVQMTHDRIVAMLPHLQAAAQRVTKLLYPSKHCRT
jgi:IclR family acetate operon transcriptional repressor